MPLGGALRGPGWVAPQGGGRGLACGLGHGSILCGHRRDLRWLRWCGGVSVAPGAFGEEGSKVNVRSHGPVPKGKEGPVAADVVGVVVFVALAGPSVGPGRPGEAVAGVGVHNLVHSYHYPEEERAHVHPLHQGARDEGNDVENVLRRVEVLRGLPPTT